MASCKNVTFVVSFMFAITTIFVLRKKSMLIVILSAVLYLFLSDFEAPLIRAALMAVVAFGAQSTGWLVSAWRSLMPKAGIMLAIEPDWIMDIGFILSFVSTASIMLFERKLDNLLKFVPKFLREGLSTSFVAQIGVDPVLFVTFGEF